jgi:hypothetical protein
MARRPSTIWLVDCNNVRGVLHFPDLAVFCAAVCRWAHSERDLALLVLSVDHGNCEEGFAVSDKFAVTFSGETLDADTQIVHAVDALLAASCSTPDEFSIVVVTSDHLLRQRCRHQLPKTALESPLGERRPDWEASRVTFKGSDAFGHLLKLGVNASTDMASAAFLPDPPAALDGDKDCARSRASRRRAERKAKLRQEQLRANTVERTADRVRDASLVHTRIAARIRGCEWPQVSRGAASDWVSYACALGETCPVRRTRPWLTQPHDAPMHVPALTIRLSRDALFEERGAMSRYKEPSGSVRSRSLRGTAETLLNMSVRAELQLACAVAVVAVCAGVSIAWHLLA